MYVCLGNFKIGQNCLQVKKDKNKTVQNNRVYTNVSIECQMMYTASQIFFLEKQRGRYMFTARGQI